MRNETYDIVVIGSGIAGLSYAIRCADFAKVLIVTKGNIGESNTMYAQGGIAAVLDDKDSIENHISDTLTAGDNHCNKDCVRLLAENAKDAILYLEQLSVNFNKTDNGTFDLHREGGHSHARIVHHADATGKEVESALVNVVKNNTNITIYENYFAIDLLVKENKCYGALIFKSDSEEFLQVNAKVTMLASGGLGQVFLQNTNPDVATGDGFAMAYRAGAEMEDMEFVQFHPTTLFARKGRTFLITEALRGFGAILKNSKGKTFMENVHPLSSLAPRDIVSRAIIQEMNKDNSEFVYLDATKLDRESLEKHFPNIFERCLLEGLDISKDMIPVVPAAHYMCGGIKTDLHARSSIENLYACGECAATGVHGANRLASNSLLEGIVFAKQAANDTQQKIQETFTSAIFGNLEYKTPEVNCEECKQEVGALKRYLQAQMWRNCGIVRTESKLTYCFEELDELQEKTEKDLCENGFSIATMELLNMVTCSKLIVEAALKRTESKGCHYRAD
ncbi:MAG: L-aspartate oxidase [Chitinophagales bacterium]|nr:L-aspartate oxidase [Chitinophagales bacterium]